MILRPRSRAEEIALFRSEIVGALVRRELSRGELKRELEALSQIRFRVPGSACTRSYSVPTLQRWYYAYRTGGLPALNRNRARTAAMAVRCPKTRASCCARSGARTRAPRPRSSCARWWPTDACPGTRCR
jgi:hypothetical protein